jgi:hypothetical protein
LPLAASVAGVLGAQATIVRPAPPAEQAPPNGEAAQASPQVTASPPVANAASPPVADGSFSGGSIGGGSFVLLVLVTTAVSVVLLAAAALPASRFPSERAAAMLAPWRMYIAAVGLSMLLTAGLMFLINRSSI